MVVQMEESKRQESSGSEEATPLATMMKAFLNNLEINIPRNEIPVDFFGIIFERFYNHFYEKGENTQETAFRRITEVNGIKVEFEKGAPFPYSKKDHSGGKYRIIVLPDDGETSEEKKIKIFQVLKEFDCLEALGTYQLLLSMLNSYLYHPKNLIDFLKKSDPNPTPEMQKVYTNMFEWLEQKGSLLSRGRS